MYVHRRQCRRASISVPGTSLLSDPADLDFRGLILYCQSNLTLRGTSHISTSLLSVTLPSPAGLQAG